MTGKEIKHGIYWVGAKDWNRRVFDALIPLPQGTSYNAYLVKGREKTALIDTVNPGFEKELVQKVKEVTDLITIDYIVMNHAEPDHAGSIPFMMRMINKAQLITTQRGKKMAQIYYHIPEERIIPIKDGDTIDLGVKTLKCIEAPWLHWPETMFTYIPEDKILFSCDFFGSHTAFGFYDDDIEDIIALAKRYFGEIMMPFRRLGERALEKIKDLEIEIIGPSHGPIYRNPGRIIDIYRQWTSGETKEKAIVIYVSMWGATEALIRTMVETLIAQGIEVSLYNLIHADTAEIAKDLVDSAALVFGAPTVLGGLHPLALYASHLVKALRPPLKYGVILSSYGWGGGAVRQALEILRPTKIEVVGTLQINGPPSDEDHQKIVEMASLLSDKIKGR